MRPNNAMALDVPLLDTAAVRLVLASATLLLEVPSETAVKRRVLTTDTLPLEDPVVETDVATRVLVTVVRPLEDPLDTHVSGIVPSTTKAVLVLDPLDTVVRTLARLTTAIPPEDPEDTAVSARVRATTTSTPVDVFGATAVSLRVRMALVTPEDVPVWDTAIIGDTLKVPLPLELPVDTAVSFLLREIANVPELEPVVDQQDNGQLSAELMVIETLPEELVAPRTNDPRTNRPVIEDNLLVRANLVTIAVDALEEDTAVSVLDTPEFVLFTVP